VVKRLFVLCLALCACEPDLADDGVYGCSDGDCPDDFACRSDMLCYGPDVERAELYKPCSEDDECENRHCNKHQGGTYGQCGAECTQSSQCGTAGTQEGICEVLGGVGICLGECDADSDCADNHECLIVPMTAGIRACHALPANYLDVILCTSSMGCPAGMQCARDTAHDTNGVCSYPCAMPVDSCPGTQGSGPHSECALMGSITNATPTDAGCLRPCMAQGDCMNAGVACAMIPGSALSTKFCIPPGWL
jgi:hypothetical protein